MSFWFSGEFSGEGCGDFAEHEFAGVGVVVEKLAVATPVDGDVELFLGVVRRVAAA
jgi:hypothetical protein